MNETIRGFFTCRMRWWLGVGIGGWVLCFGAAFVLTDRESPNPVWIAAAFGTLFCAILSVQLFVKCPRCSQRLGHIAMPLVIPGFKPKPNFCLYCGVSFDEPREQQMSINPIK